MKNIFPKKIIFKQGEIVNEEALLHRQILQIGLNESDVCTIIGNGSVILDFGKELSGGVRILTSSVEGNKSVRLRFGESVGETCADIGEKNATNDHSLRDFCIELQNYSDMTFGGTGFRFLRIDTQGENTKVAIKSIVATSDTDERREIGKFFCDDKKINEIWNTAAYTLRLCLHNGYFWDGIKRDRLVWIGDLYPEFRSAHCLYKNDLETKNSLLFAKSQTPLTEWMNGIPMYSMWWLYILCDYYKFNRDDKFIEEQLDYITGLVDKFDKYVDKNGNTTFEFNFIDWPSDWLQGEPLEKKSDEEAGVNYLLTITLKKVAWLLKEFEVDDKKCKNILKRLSLKKYRVNSYKQIAALGVVAGEKNENNCKVLLKDGAAGFSTFMSYFILTAIAEFGEYDSALSLMKEYYGGMLSVGATTFWEDFDIDWLQNAASIDEMPRADKKDIHGDYGRFCYLGYRHSFCHGWSAGVIAYLMETVAGVRQESKDTIHISPNMSGLNHIKISYPTAKGVLDVETTKDKDGKINTRIQAPNGLNIITD